MSFLLPNMSTLSDERHEDLMEGGWTLSSGLETRDNQPFSFTRDGGQYAPKTVSRSVVTVIADTVTFVSRQFSA